MRIADIAHYFPPAGFVASENTCRVVKDLARAGEGNSSDSSFPTIGAFLLDVEVELAWGIIDKQINKNYLENASIKCRRVLERILLLLEEYSIPTTWGIVGHLMLSQCERESDMPHPEMPRPSYKWMTKDWYENDPCKTLAEEPAFYGKDIIDRLVQHKLKMHNSADIACHSFSHQVFGDPGCGEAVVEAEVKRCLNLFEVNYGFSPQVFIFPRDSVGHIDILRREGFISFRGPISHGLNYSESDYGIVRCFRKKIALAVYLASFYLSIPPPVVHPKIENGLVNISGSLCYNKKPFIPLGLIVKKAKKGIDRAVNEKKMFHLYTHLINFGTAPDFEAFFEGFEEILAYADLKRNEGKLEITTMRGVAANLKKWNWD